MPSVALQWKPSPGWVGVRAEMGAGERPHHVATRLLRQQGMHAAPVDVFGIAKLLEVDVRRVTRPGWSGAIQSSKESAVVWINGDEPLVRQRFSLAHELGHLFFHELGTEFRDVSFSGNQKETEANQFAADLLIPLWMLDSYMTQAPELAARRFQVSLHAMTIQMARLRGYPTRW